MNLTRRNILKALGITAIASILPITLKAEPVTMELKVTGTSYYKRGDVIAIRPPQKFTVDDNPYAIIIPPEKDYIIHAIKDRETLIVSEVI